MVSRWRVMSTFLQVDQGFMKNIIFNRAKWKADACVKINHHRFKVCARFNFFLGGGGRTGGLRMCRPPYHPP